MLRNKPLWIFLIVAVVIAGGGYAYYAYSSAQDLEVDEPELQTAVVRQGDIVLRASGSGELIAVDEVALGFGVAGPIAELYVQVGDDVHVGDVLAVQGEREQLEAAVASERLAVMNAEKALQELYDNADIKAAQAWSALAEARENLEDAEYRRLVQQEGNRASASTIDAAKAELALAESALERARAEYNKYYGLPTDDPNRALALTKLYAAQQKVDTALRALNWYTGYPSEIEQAQLDADVALAQALLEQAEREYALTMNGPDPDEVTKAELQLANAEAKLAVSERNLRESTIIAPLDGTVLKVNGQVGEQVSGNFISIADLRQSHLEIFLDETDLDKVAVGNAVEVIFDALPDSVFHGEVVLVDPSLYQSQGVATIRGIVALEEASIGELPLGLGAAVDVIAGEALGVPIVPFESLRELEPGVYAVFVIEDGEPRLRPVEVGLMDFSFVEIKSGLQPGDVVSTGIVETGQ
jgi:multidrug efflux pump subunit AcrA (membrane-fusion protein)